VRAKAAAPRRRAHDVDSLIRGLVEPTHDIAIAAVGGYGRARLSAMSDIDILVLVSSRPRDAAASLRTLLYPLWDAGQKVGHSVRTPKEAVEFARGDLHTTTALLTTRFICGSEDLYEDLSYRRDRWILVHRKKLVRSILDAATARRANAGRAGWSLAPNLRDAAGGLRDLHTVEWLQRLNSGAHIPSATLQAGELLLASREALHEVTGRKNDVLHIDLQPSVAKQLGLEDRVDELMSGVHFAARRIEHDTSLAMSSTSMLVLGGPKRSGSTTVVAAGIAIADGELTLTTRSDGRDVTSGLRLAAWSAHTGRPIALNQYRWLERAFSTASSASWNEAARDAWMHLLTGPHVAPVLELLDNLDALTKLIPEWSAVRARAQHDPYHRYTVDGHSFMAVAEATSAIATDPIAHNAAHEAGDLQPLYLATLLHDIGKGSGDDHSVAGEALARRICVRMGVDPMCIEDVALLVRLHLLLPDTATRRDLDDGSVIEGVAKAVGDARRLRLLYILSVADARATGPQAWSEWKESLLADLYRKVLTALETGELPARSDVARRAREIEALEPALSGRAEALLAALPASYPSSATASELADELVMMSEPLGGGTIRHSIEPAPGGRALVVLCAPDRPGTLARAAGVLSLHRISVLRAQAYSTTTGLALERFVVSARDSRAWEGFEADLEEAFSGRLALDARLRQKAADYKPSRPLIVDVRVLNDASEHSTVVEVRTHDALGLLYAITAALTELDADIHVAKIDTLGERVVDVFYVRNSWGSKLDAAQGSEVDRAIRDRIARTLG
jgi:[protein-PII] uridylyltransferase